MRTRILLCTVISFFSLVPTVSADQQEKSPFKRFPVTVQFQPFLEVPMDYIFGIPLEYEQDVLDIGGGGVVQASFPIGHTGLHSATGFSYSFIPVKAATSLSLLHIRTGLSYNLVDIPLLQWKIGIGAGGFYAFFNEDLNQRDTTVIYNDQFGYNPVVHAATTVELFFTPAFSAGVSGAYTNYIGFFQSAQFSVHLNLHLDGLSKKTAVRVDRWKPVFPALTYYHHKNAIGTLTFINQERFPVEKLEISIVNDSYMDAPSLCIGPEKIAPEQSAGFSVPVLFNEKILTISEDGMLPLKILVRYDLNGTEINYSTTKEINVYNRNAITWDNDAKAAAFVNVKDPEVLRFSKLVAGIVRNSGFETVNREFRMAMGMFEALGHYGLTYVLDPNSPSFDEVSTDSTLLDFLQYPKQTLSYKGGDCDDLTVLYCAMLESVGIETAFITIPGHIFMAFSLDMDEAEGRRTFSSADNLIIREGNCWVPVEVTLVGTSFLEAWRTGAAEWKEAETASTEGFLPVEECWRTFQPLGSPPDVVDVVLDMERLPEMYNQEIVRFLEQELYPRISVLEKRLQTSAKPLRIMNAIGVLYARYGMYDRASDMFRHILEQNPDYYGALVNLANIHQIREEYQDALRYYQKAEQQHPNNWKLQINLSKVYFHRKNYAMAARYYNAATAQDTARAEEYSYLALSKTASDLARAADVIEPDTSVEWIEE